MININVTHDLSHLFGPIRDQGFRPTCLAFATSDVHAAVRSGNEVLSTEYIHYHAHVHGCTSISEGTTLPNILKALESDGQPKETDWPYTPTKPPDLSSWSPPADIAELFCRASEHLQTHTKEVFNAVQCGHPTVLLTYLSPSFFAGATNGVIDFSSAEPPDPNKRHALAAIATGETNSGQAVMVRNSWGEKWGICGCAWLTEEYLNQALFGVAILKEDLSVYTDTATA